jgi:hypothetical protein
VDAGVDQNEHPDGRRHEAHASPHGQHSAGVVVLLERGAALALDEDNDRVEDFVELGEVEPPAPEGKALVPDPANVGLVGQARRRVDQDVRVLAGPAAGGRIVRDGVAEAARAVDLAESVDGAHDRVGVAVVREGVLQRAHHGHAGDGRVHGQEDIVEDDEGEERARLGDAPRLVLVLAVVPVQVRHRDGIHSRNAQRDLVAQRALKDVLGDVERVREGRRFRVRVRDRGRRRVGRELEDRPRGEVGRVQRWAGARHDVRVCCLAAG